MSTAVNESTYAIFRPRWSDSDVEKLRSLYEAGASHRKIARELGRGAGAIHTALRTHGINVGQTRRPKAKFAEGWSIEKIEALRAECVSLYPELLPTQIARKTGASKDFVRASIARAGRTVPSEAKRLLNGETAPERFPTDDLIPVYADRATPWAWANNNMPYLSDSAGLNEINQGRLYHGLPPFIVRDLRVG